MQDVVLVVKNYILQKDFAYPKDDMVPQDCTEM